MVTSSKLKAETRYAMKGMDPNKLFVALSAAAFLFLAIGVADAERLPVKNLTIDDGLPTNTINRIVPDSRGFFWVCTHSGLARYDGYGFTNFTAAQGLPGDRVWDLLETPSGEYWVATNGGLVKFTPDGSVSDRVINRQEATSLDTMPMFVTYETPGAKNVTDLALDAAGRLWVGTARGLFRFEDNQFTEVALPFHHADDSKHVYAVFVDHDGAVWAGAYDHLFRVTDAGAVAHHQAGTVFQAFTRDRRGRLWAGTSHNGVVEVSTDPGGRPVIVRTFAELSEAGNWVSAIVESSDGKIWMATDDGLVEFNPGADVPTFEIYTRNSGLGHIKFTTILEDRSGNLWLGTRSGGIFRVVRRGMTYFGEEDDIEFVRAVFACDGGEACFVGFLSDTALDDRGAKADLAKQDFAPYIWSMGRVQPGGFSWLVPKFGREIKYFGWGDRQVIFQSRNSEWWIATGEGVFRFPSGRFEELATSKPLDTFDVSRGLTPADVFRVFEDSRGDVWIATIGSRSEGLFRWQRGTGELHDLTTTMRKTIPLKTNFVSAIREDGAGNIWLGFYDSGLGRVTNGRFEYFDESAGAPRGGVTDILVDGNGKIWLTSGRDGVVSFSGVGEDGKLDITGFNISNGLSSNRTYAMTTDWRNLIYVGTDRDVNRIDPVSGKIVQLEFGDGLPQQQVRSAYTDRDGILWFGTTAGLLKYVPVADEVVESLDVLLTRVTVDGVSRAVSALGSSRVAMGDLPTETKQIEVEFASLSAVTNRPPRYQYRLESADEWSPPAAERTLNLAGLAAGSYTIEIRAVGTDVAISSNPAEVSFTILPPFYLRWWFVLLCALAVTAVAYGLYEYRLQRLLELERVRTRIATDLHDDIGANLTRISVLSEVAKQRSANGNGALMESIAEIARESVASMSDIVWAIAPDHDSLLDLTRLMRRHAEEVFSLRDVDLIFDAPVIDMKLSVGVRRDLLLIFKEAVNNAAKHSDCRTVEIDFSCRGSILRLRIADDGRGFDTADRHEGHGLQSMKNRARQLGGEITIESNGKTVVQLELELRRSFLERV